MGPKLKNVHLSFDVPFMNNTFVKMGGETSGARVSWCSTRACKADKLSSNWMVAKSRSMFEGLVGQLDRRGWLSWAGASFFKAIYGGKSGLQASESPVACKNSFLLGLLKTRPFWVGVATCDVKPTYVFGDWWPLPGFRFFLRKMFLVLPLFEQKGYLECGDYLGVVNISQEATSYWGQHLIEEECLMLLKEYSV